MGIIITYDVSDEHVELKKMIAKNYSKTMIGDGGVIVNLPNTTLYKEITDPQVAIEELTECAKGLIEIERAIPSTTNSWWGIHGEVLK